MGKENNRLGIIIGLVILLFFMIYGFFERYQLSRNSSFVFGVSEGIKKGVKGNLRLYYHFNVDGVEYTGRVPEAFCSECKTCCNAGDTVIVRYQNDNPENNDLVTTMPN
jgi:hypothetical protein